MRSNYSDALRRRVRRLNDDTVLYVEALARKAEDIRRTRAEFEAAGVTRTNVTVFDDGAVRLTGTPAAKIDSLTSDSYDTDLDYDLPWSTFSWELDETIGANPVLTKVEVFLNRKRDGGQPTFDGQFALQLYRIDRLIKHGAIASDFWMVSPAGPPVIKAASEMAADQELVAFEYSATGLTGVPAPVINDSWRPSPPDSQLAGGLSLLQAPLDNIPARCVVCVVRAVSGTNTNYGMGRDSTKSNKDVQASKGTLRHTTLSVDPLADVLLRGWLKAAGGTGTVRCRFTLASYPATGSVQLLKTSSPASNLALGQAPLGTIEFFLDKDEPSGTSIIGSARVNSADPWVVVKDGQTPADVGLAVAADGRYEMKAEFAANAGGDVTATLRGMGITDRILYDVTEIATLEGLNESFDPLSGEVKLQDGRCLLQHTGVRDRRDIATRLMSENNFTDVELRAYRGHPDLPRDQWLLINIWRCDDYKDSETQLELTIVSVLERLKGRFPRGSGTLFGYLLTSSDSDLPVGADFRKTMREGATTAATLAVSLAASATEESFGYTSLGIPGLVHWPPGPFTVKVKVTVGDSDVFLKVRVTRVNAAGTAQQSSAYTAEQQLTAATGYVFSIPNTTWTPGAVGDRLRVDYSFRNNVGSVQSVTIELNTVNAEIVAPWTPTLNVDPKAYNGVTVQTAYLDWRDVVVGLLERYRGAPPANASDVVTYNFEGGLRDVDGKRILERIAQLAGNIVIASQGVIKAVPALRPTSNPVAYFPLATTVVHDVDLGLRARVPEYACAFGWDTARRNAFAGEVLVRHQAALTAYDLSRIDNPSRRAEDDLCRWVLGQDLAYKLALGVVQGIGLGFRRTHLTSLIPYPEIELGDPVGVEVELTWRDPTSGRAHKGPAWVLGVVLGLPNGVDGRVFDIWLPYWSELVSQTTEVWRRNDRELPLVYHELSNLAAQPQNAYVRLQAFPVTSSVFYYYAADGTTPPDRDSPLWIPYSGAVTIARDPTADKLFSFYSKYQGIASPVTTFRVPPGKLQTILNVSGTRFGGSNPNVQVQFTASVDPDVRRLRWYIRKNAWPTSGGGGVGDPLNETYFVKEVSTSVEGGGFDIAGAVQAGGLTCLSAAEYSDSGGAGDHARVIAIGFDKDDNPTARFTLDYTVPAIIITVVPTGATVNQAGTSCSADSTKRKRDFTWTPNANVSDGTHDLLVYQTKDGVRTLLFTETSPATVTSKTGVVTGTIAQTGAPSRTETYDYELKAGGVIVEAGSFPSDTYDGVSCTPPPDLTSVGNSPRGGDFCTDFEEWILTVSWTTDNPNDALYRIDIERATDAAGVSYSPWQSDLTTDDGSVEDYTGIFGNTGGSDSPSTSYRKYKIKLIRRSDSAVIEEQETAQESITVYTELCA